MKYWSVLALAGLLLIGVAPTYGELANHRVDLAPSLGAYSNAEHVAVLPSAGPRRDPAGDDDIFYDQGDFNGSVIYTYNGQGGLIGRVIFTAVTNFTLQAIKVAPSNGANIQNVRATAWVYRQDGNNNLTDRLIAKQFTVPNGADWFTIELEENEYLQFNEGEKFSIIYGPMPGGDNAHGPHLSADQNTRTNTSYLNVLTNGSVPTAYNTWSPNQIDRDLYIRANGSLEQFTDVQVNEIFNGDPENAPSGIFHMLAGTTVRYKAQIANLGESVENVNLDWQIFDADSNEIFFWEQTIRAIDARDTIIVECDTTWAAPETVGRYWAQASIVNVDADADLSNNVGSLDQYVIDPTAHADEWLTYGGAFNARDASNNAGLAVIYFHPGGDVVYKVTDMRVQVMADDETDVPISIFRCNAEVNAITQWLDTTVHVGASEEAQTIELAFAGESQLSISPDSGAFIVVYNTNTSGVLKDINPPIAGASTFMPRAMWITWDGQGYNPSGSGDYLIDARITASDDPLPGRRLVIEPDSLNFGDSLMLGMTHQIDAVFTATGADSVNVRSIQVPAVLRNFVTVSPSSFVLGPQESQVVSVTYRNNGETNSNSRLQVNSNWDNHLSFNWQVHASTVGGPPFNSVNENVKPGVPGDFELSQNFPNPFNPTTTINFALPIAGDVTIAVFDISGRQVESTVRQNLHAGYHSVDFNASSLPAGVYTYKLTSGSYSSSMKMALVK